MNEAAESNNRPLAVGDYAPDFTLDLADGQTVTLSELRGKNVVLYFYPKDDTPGCTKEAIDFTHYADDFDNARTTVIGISKDSVESHEKFAAKHNLEVTLASDERNSVCEAYDVWVEKNMYGKQYMGVQRDTYLIDNKGVIKQIWRKVKVDGHAQEVLDAARALQS